MSFKPYPKYKESGVEWLGRVPEHWEVRRFQRCVDIAEGQVDPSDPTYAEMALIAPNHIESGTGRLYGIETAAEQSAESGKYECRAGDVVYSKIRPSLRKVCIAPVACLCSADMYPLRPHSGLIGGYLFWTILSEYFSAFAVLESDRVAMPKINRESLKQLSVPMPTTVEQIAISTFLDHETAKIDALIAEQQRLIELLQEKRQAVISHAVTKGLDPTAPMKDSGIEWLGKVPEHWEAWKVSQAFSQISSGTTPKSDQVEYYDDGDVPWVNTGDLNDGSLLDCPKRVTAKAIKDHTSLKLYPPGSLLFAMYGATIGKLAMLGFPATVNQACCVLVEGDAIDPLFMFFWFLGFRSHVLSLATGGGQPNVSQDIVRSLRVACPSRREQKKIVDYLSHQSSRFDALVEESTRAIALLQERRSALISAAVTGQIDVRGFTAGGSEAA